MQWQSISIPYVQDGGRATTTGYPWNGDEPQVGELNPVALAALCRRLAEQTEPGVQFFFALWEGYGWIHGGSAVAFLQSCQDPPDTAGHPGTHAVPPAFAEKVMAGPRLLHPGRAYLLFTGPPEAAMDLGSWPTQDWFLPQSPDLIWSSDHSWCVAT